MAEEKKTTSSGGMDPKLAALLCWLFAPISSIIFMMLDDMKKDDFVQFNAKESLFYSLAQILLMFGTVLSFIPILGWILGCIIWLAEVALLIGRIIVAVKAYNGEKVVLPVIGDMASK